MSAQAQSCRSISIVDIAWSGKLPTYLESDCCEAQDPAAGLGHTQWFAPSFDRQHIRACRQVMARQNQLYDKDDWPWLECMSVACSHKIFHDQILAWKFCRLSCAGSGFWPELDPDCCLSSKAHA